MTTTTPDPEIIYRDAHLLVLAKPAGLPTTAPDSQADCLVVRARRLDPQAPRLHPSSRLDAEVTGLVLFARTRLATEALLAARRAGQYTRCYLGVSAGALSPAVGRIEAAIALDPRDRRKRRALASDDAGGGKASAAKSAVTRYRVGAVAEQAALLWLYPQTGRTHQLRVHAAHCGQPLLGDRHYGGAVRVVRSNGRVVRIPRVMLHCTAVRVPAPQGGGDLSFYCVPPPDMCAAFAALGGEPGLLQGAPPEPPSGG